MVSLTVRTVVITGANRGLGLEFARQYRAMGERVIGTSRKPSPELSELDVEVVELDVADEASIARAREQIGKLTDRIDVLINNAGIMGGTQSTLERLGSLSMETMMAVYRTNAAGPILFTQACLDLLQGAETSKVAFLSSLYSQIGARERWAANEFGYSASKAALNLFVRNLGMSLTNRGVRAVSLDPGWARTEMGGEQAPLDPRDSVQGMITVLENLTREQSGSYISWTGETVAS